MLAVVTAAGFTITLRGGSAAPSPANATVLKPTAVETVVAAMPTPAPPLIRASLGLTQVAPPSTAGRQSPTQNISESPPVAGSGPALPPQVVARAAGVPSVSAPAAGQAAPARTDTPVVGASRAVSGLDDVNPRASSSAAVAAAARQTPAEPEEIVVYHEVRQGDTLSVIAQKYDVSVASLVAINPLVTDRHLLKVGLRLYVPTKEGVLHFVRRGETITDLAETFGVKTEAIVAFKPNNIADANSIREGELVLIPGGKAPPPPAPPPTPVPTPAPAAAPRPAAVISTPAAAARAPAVASFATVAPAVRAPTAPPPPPAAVRPAAAGWMWPITGRLSSYYGPGHPLGIDIDLYGRAGAPIGAARGGTVTFAGGNPCCSYGYYVEIDHGDGFRTLYAHFNAPPPVRIGQQVNQGQVVGYAGTTGYSTGVHLHFEVRRNGTAVNPLGYLP